jgi:hypothetical protein
LRVINTLGKPKNQDWWGMIAWLGQNFPEIDRTQLTPVFTYYDWKQKLHIHVYRNILTRRWTHVCEEDGSFWKVKPKENDLSSVELHETKRNMLVASFEPTKYQSQPMPGDIVKVITGDCPNVALGSIGIISGSLEVEPVGWRIGWNMFSALLDYEDCILSHGGPVITFEKPKFGLQLTPKRWRFHCCREDYLEAGCGFDFVMWTRCWELHL